MLVHQLANLLDGSLRCVSLARRSLSDADPTGAHEKLGTAQTAMEQMASLVRAARPGWNGDTSRVPARRGGVRGSGSLAEAISTAVDVMRPIGADCGVGVECDVPAGFALLPDWCMYRVVTDAVRNSVEAVKGAGLQQGNVRVVGRIESRGGSEMAVIEISDDGPGPVRLPIDQEDRFFHAGFTTKPGGSGLGLAGAREAVEAVGGAIGLVQGLAGRPRPGAVLRIRIPIPRATEKGAAA